MNLRPLGDRILIKPIANDEQTESGLVLVEHRKPETMGTVIAVGTCAHPLKAEAERLAKSVEEHDDFGPATADFADAADMLRTLVAREPLVKPGDTVIFSWTAGREIQLDDTGDRYLMMAESDILAVLET